MNEEYIKFMEAFNSKDGILVTKNIFREEKINEKKIFFIPAWHFALTRKF